MTRPSWIGQTLGGRYRIDDVLGQGGMSAVYKAYDPNLKRVVAVKMIHAHLAEDPRFVVRFEEEATAVAQLRHSNIVQVFDFNHDDDVYYMVQEFVAGETLQERLRRLSRSGRRMAVDEAVRYTVDICNAAGYAHKRGLVHRDIKPANIMIDVHGQAILMDFGIVKITGGEKHTATGAVVGTALYLPPESIRGEAPDARSDQYSLAVTLFEALNGRPPFEADSAMTLMMMHLNDPLPDLRQLRPEIPAGLAAVIEKALSKNREQRYATMEEFAAALSEQSSAAAQPGDQATQMDAATPAPIPAAGPTTRAPAGTPPASLNDTGRTITDPPPSAPLPATTRAVPATTGGQGLPSAPTAATAAQPPAAGRPKPNLAAWGGIAAGLVVILVVVGLIYNGSRKGNTPAPTNPAAVSSVGVVAAASTPTGTPEATPTATTTPTITNTPAPTATPTITTSPTPTIPAGVPYSRINAITINQSGFYVVDYETFEYTEVLPGQHVHFFFDTVTPEQAGMPGSGPWELYGGPRPFTVYRTSDRPAAASRLCVLVANRDHSVQANSGNCFILPDVNVAVAIVEQACLGGPGEAFQELARFSPGTVLQVTGISADEAWWTVANPGAAGESCWLARSLTDFSGDLSTLPLAEAPQAAAGPFVQITGISVDAQGNYVVEFTPNGFTPALPGTHMHFFYDIFTADQVGSTGGGNRLMYGGASPFTGFSQLTRPEGAGQICVLVANPDHSVNPNSGNCFLLP